MTREERAAQQAQRLETMLTRTGQKLMQLKARQREDARAKRDRRRQRVGTLADHAGLLTWDDTTLAGLFQILATLRETHDPVAVLEGLLTDPVSPQTPGPSPALLAPDGVAPTSWGTK
jgi:hypothetical protein